MPVRMVLVVRTDTEPMVGRPELDGLPDWMQNLLIVNAPLSVKGCVEACQLIERLKKFEPFDGIFYSWLGRASMMASFFVLHALYELELNKAIKGLGAGVRRENGQTYLLPMEDVDHVEWQLNALEGLKEICFEVGILSNPCVLVITHAPQVAAIALYAKGITNWKAIRDAVPTYQAKGLIVIDVADDDAITIVEE